MRGTVAKRLRREAQQIGQFYPPEKKYVQTYKGENQLAHFGRKVLKLLRGDDGKLSTEVFTMSPKEWGTIRHQRLSVRGIYKQLKQQYYQKTL